MSGITTARQSISSPNGSSANLAKASDLLAFNVGCHGAMRLWHGRVEQGDLHAWTLSSPASNKAARKTHVQPKMGRTFSRRAFQTEMYTGGDHVSDAVFKPAQGSRRRPCPQSSPCSLPPTFALGHGTHGRANGGGSTGATTSECGPSRAEAWGRESEDPTSYHANDIYFCSSRTAPKMPNGS
ncbi:hypothetical protein DCS_04206 [Drechmeria coniospora]|uniref:Uncharacterized protein n=1 Tax=Drechmeria coniospora TaxID=98403 RepID=A0A151GJD6_DRECN|nr:hypothetical protein DCS_04206 [Drechmeria coniospora]KYK57199.1 hypothetical protein DCS_04206 [Drechmeria coniospora]